MSWLKFDGRHVRPDDVIVPCLTVLPMGWSWALHLERRMHEHVLSKTNCTPSDVIVDRVICNPLYEDGARNA
eukprot:6195784-Karenia_brevis.AAC.1